MKRSMLEEDTAKGFAFNRASLFLPHTRCVINLDEIPATPFTCPVAFAATSALNRRLIQSKCIARRRRLYTRVTPGLVYAVSRNNRGFQPNSNIHSGINSSFQINISGSRDTLQKNMFLEYFLGFLIFFKMFYCEE